MAKNAGALKIDVKKFALKIEQARVESIGLYELATKSKGKNTKLFTDAYDELHALENFWHSLRELSLLTHKAIASVKHMHGFIHDSEKNKAK